MKEESKKKLLEIARKSVEAAVKRQRKPEFETDDLDLLEMRGAFVTLRNPSRGKGDLRGCIGHFGSDRALYLVVSEMAASAATKDSRFYADPITVDELPQIHIEISALSRLTPIANPLDIELGKHGIYIRQGYRGGCFLPQVAAETGWSKEEFLSHCCSHKVGLPPDAWKDPKTEVLVFTVEIIEEEETQEE